MVGTVSERCRETAVRRCCTRLCYLPRNIIAFFFSKTIVSTKSRQSPHVPFSYLTLRPARSKSFLSERDWFQRPSVKNVLQMKWIKTMNRDPISPKQQHDTQIHSARRKSINANGVLDALRWLQDTRNFKLYLNKLIGSWTAEWVLHWFLGKCLEVDLLILGLFFFCWWSRLFTDANPAIILHNRPQQEVSYCRMEDRKLIL